MTTIMAPISGRYFINEGSWHSTTLRTVPGACKHSKSLSYNCLLQDRFNPQARKVEAKVRLLGRTFRGVGGWVELCRSPLPGTAWSSHMESQPCRVTGSPLTDQVGWDWTKWPQVGVWGLSPGQLLFLRQPWCYFLFSLSFPFLLSPPPPQAWPSPPQPCLWAFLHLEIRSRSDMSPPSTSWPRGPASPTPSGALWQQSPPSPEMVGPPWGSASCIPRGRLEDGRPARKGSACSSSGSAFSLIYILLGAVSGAQTCQAGFTSY